MAAATAEMSAGNPQSGWTAILSHNRTSESFLDVDSQLVEQCLRGEETAWEDLVRTHTRRVYAVCYRFAGKDSEAQDLTQDVFLRVFKTLKSFRSGDGSFVVWLNRLTRNLLIDRIEIGFGAAPIGVEKSVAAIVRHQNRGDFHSAQPSLVVRHRRHLRFVQRCQLRKVVG